MTTKYTALVTMYTALNCQWQVSMMSVKTRWLDTSCHSVFQWPHAFEQSILECLDIPSIEKLNGRARLTNQMTLISSLANQMMIIENHWQTLAIEKLNG